ncbi:phosphotyrosine protein phosphatase [Knoellia sinensis KCTC 19936]|uniref:Phosphotyrosine protein phosphatase n=1 Tax=Knoellia sinensis KCTC 19936 TaxID=1385520 RepID=A0A0A0JBZ8_9MICO|nr:phosphotyrosine protein phosphatase [Knoellia sinensis KCTC 19936]
MEAPLRVLFVCTANISRSPYAERRAAQLAENSGLQVASAGIPGYPGRGMDPEMGHQLRERGGEPNGHVSRSVTNSVLTETDLVITHEYVHRLRITSSFPEHAIKVFGLHQLADSIAALEAPERGLALLDQVYSQAVSDGMQRDVADPYKRGRAAARACALEIDEALAVIVPVLAGIPAVLSD